MPMGLFDPVWWRNSRWMTARAAVRKGSMK